MEIIIFITITIIITSSSLHNALRPRDSTAITFLLAPQLNVAGYIERDHNDNDHGNNSDPDNDTDRDNDNVMS